MKKPLTSSERSGLLILAAASLLVVAAGLFTSQCNGKDSFSSESTSQPEVISKPAQDEATETKTSSLKKRKDSSKKKPHKYRRRDPRNEPVNKGRPE